MDMRIAKWCFGMLVACGVLFGTAGVEAAVSVTDVTAKQRYPWNGLVDIRFKASGIEEGVAWPLVLAAAEPDSDDVRELSHFWIVRDGTNSTDRVVHADGEYELLWDARADLGEVVCTNMVVQVSFEERPLIQLWAGGPYWADRNVGAEDPWDCGYYFWWGDTIGYTWENGQWVASDGSSSGFSFSDAPNWRMDINKLLSNGWITTNHVLAPGRDAAQVHWGRGWRMPTEQESRDLCNNCDRTWVTTNGVKGYVVRGRGDYASASIFLPAAGWGDKTEWAHEGWGHFWASSPFEAQSQQSMRLNFNSRSFYMDYHFDRHIGATCRPVQDVAEQQTP